MTDILLATFFQTLIDWDTNVFLAINGCHHEYLDPFMAMFSDRFVWIPFYASLLYVMCRFFPWRVNVFCLIVLTVVIAVNDQVSASVLRSFVGRLRPANVDNPISPLVHIIDGYRGGRFGFPSAHSANCWGATFFVFYVFRRRLLTATMVVWTVVTCWSRMYLGVHYFGDILGGMVLGFVSASLVYYIFQRAMHRVTETYKPYQPNAPQMYLPVVVCWTEMLVLLLVSLALKANGVL